MLKTNFQKTITNGNQSTDAAAINVNGTALTEAIQSLIAANAVDDAMFEGCAFLASNNTFTGSNTIEVLTIPNVATFNGASDTATFDVMPKTSTDLTSTITTDSTLTNKKYVDAKVAGLLATNNTFTGGNTFTGITVSYAMNATASGIAMSFIPTLLGDYTQPTGNALACKKYVDDKVAAVVTTSNIFTQPNTFNGAITVANAFSAGGSGISLSFIPTLQGDYTQPTGNALTSKKYVDDKVAAVVTTANTFTAANTFSGAVTVTGAMSASSSGVSLAFIPTLQGSYTQPTGNSLTSKAYVDSIVPTVSSKPDSICFGQQAITYASGSNYILEAPYLGTSTTNNSTGVYYDFYINFPATSSTSPVYTPLTHAVTFDFSYFVNQCLPVTGSISNTANTATFTTAPTNANIAYASTNTALTTCNANFTVIIRNNGLYVYGPSQVPTAIWTNNSSGGAGQGTKELTFPYGGSVTFVAVQAMKCNAINFTYVSGNKFKVTVGFPNMQNNPTKNYWISNLGYSAKLRQSMPCTASFFGQGSTITTPSTNVNTMSGGAWISSS